MGSLIFHSSATAQWYTLIGEATSSAGVKLNAELESYLVFMLMRNVTKQTLFEQAVATEFLESYAYRGQLRQHQLREVADKCLLYAGLFPKYGRRFRLNENYYTKIGRSAYWQLADTTEEDLSLLYSQLCTKFTILKNVLIAARKPTMELSQIPPFFSRLV